MDDFIRRHVEAGGGWGSKEASVRLPPAEVDDDYATQVIALLVERLGRRVELTRAEIAAVPARLVLLPEDAKHGFNFETRRLATEDAEPRTSD